jgi:hypothetical protein
MGRDRAAYMRDYRAMRKVKEAWAAHGDSPLDQSDRVAELEEEVRHLKALLAEQGWKPTANPAIYERTVDLTLRRFNSRPFTPVPKGGK